MKYFPVTLAVCVFWAACHTATSPQDTTTAQALTFSITSLSDEDYPDNPDIGFRSTNYDNTFFQRGSIRIDEQQRSDWTFWGKDDSIKLKQIDLKEFLPTMPAYLKEDSYLSYLALINQEWNRNQVRFGQGEFSSSDTSIVRIDLARNCLNAYLWEIIAYTQEEGNTVPKYHGWFHFPHGEYQKQLEARSGIDFAKYKDALEDWKEPPFQKIAREALREELEEVVIHYADKSDAMYPVAGARKKKFKEIIYPTSFNTMRDLQTDSALFATFTPPGFYNKADPRKTSLGRFRKLKNIRLHRIRSKANQDTLVEIDLMFQDKQLERTTHMVLGGIDLASMPALPVEEVNRGCRSSMGFGNHPFYESYAEHQRCLASHSPYYAYLCDGEQVWLDSHQVGIDGPVIHRDPQRPNVIHLWLLSFERHAVVGHYEIRLEEEV
jgi:hypothetical protein